MKVILYTRPDGGVSVVHPADSGRLKNEAEDVWMERVKERSVPQDATDIRIVDASVIPTDRTFRNAWKPDLSVDMTKAREIRRDQLRLQRKKLFEELDSEWMKSFAKGDLETSSQVEAKRQALRDAPADPRIESASTPEELKSVDPLSL